ncbi:hypothetical protein NDU88_012710 [Pleurodeles waltl]|uniref:Uncharacterized protein n=1 Tax=Pleurodeles waltl TaxID=8319 RepID=A0AAV7R5E2_PLEWA|nr:hypothetical protein NDU88_012710 [Pleurodeles waltl]
MDGKSKTFFDAGELQASLDGLGEDTSQCPLDLPAMEKDPLAPKSPEKHTRGPQHKDKNQHMQRNKEKLLNAVAEHTEDRGSTNPTHHLNRACLWFDD